MDNAQKLSPNCCVAEYKPQRLPQYKENPLIEALPPVMTDRQLFEALTLLPEFDSEQRMWSSEERMQMLLTLSSFMIPLARHVKLARTLDAMLRAGYVGRVPRTPEHAQRLQKTYELRKSAGPSVKAILESNPQLSTLLMGISGMGKTTTVKRCFSQLPQVIYHPELHIYQVTYLHVEMPSDGASIKGLAHGILQQIDKLIPGANYYENYALRGKPGADTLMRSVARVMNQHFVGFLIADEIQNLANSHKGKQTVMTELVSACNELGVPILFIGTNKAAEVFSLDFRNSRRASGHGLEHWDRLSGSAEHGEPDEWRDFIDILWTFQWVRNPEEMNEHTAAILYHFSQGVIDIAIKLFASAQARAILDGTECVTPELISDVYNKELKLLHPMIDALRDNNFERLRMFADIAPIGVGDLLDNIQRKMKAKTSEAYTVKSSHPTFVPRIATALIATGIEEDDAIQAAERVAMDGESKNVLQGTKAALNSLTANKPVPRAKPKSNKSGVQIQPDFESRPCDYRRAITSASQSGSTIYEQLQKLGMARPLDELLELT